MQTTEENRILDHRYDGIQEYDNPLPGWWVAIFWITIFVSFCYPLYYHLGVGPKILGQFNDDAAAYYELQAKQLEGIEITEEVIAGFQAESALMAGMQQIFASTCATCHNAQGQGDIGPNLTDDHWLHGGSLVQIYETIRDGVPGKGMQAWQEKLGAARVLHMAAFIGTLRGTNVPGKSPEGKLYEPETAPPTNATGSQTPPDPDATPVGDGKG